MQLPLGSYEYAAHIFERWKHHVDIEAGTKVTPQHVFDDSSSDDTIDDEEYDKLRPAVFWQGGL